MSLKLPSAKSEFERLCRELEATGLVRFYIKTGRFSDRSLGGYVRFETKPYLIALTKQSNRYRKLILYVLHEYAHVLDYRNPRSKQRWKTAVEPQLLDKYPELPKKQKQAIFATELFADKLVPKLLRRFNVQIVYDQKELQMELVLTSLCWRNVLLNGKNASRRQSRLWKQILTNTKKINCRKYLILKHDEKLLI